MFGTGLAPGNLLGFLIMGSDNYPIRPWDGANVWFLDFTKMARDGKNDPRSSAPDELLALKMILFEPNMLPIDH